MQSYRIRWNEAKYKLLRRSRSFKVTDVGTNRKIVCNFLLVINSNWILSRTVLKLSEIVVQILDSAFLSLSGGLANVYYSS